MATRFRAPWSTLLLLMTGGVSLLLVGVAGYGIFAADAEPLIGVLIPLAILLGGALFAIRGYAVVDGTLYILRPGWRTSFDLSTLQSAEIQPGAMSWFSLRSFGNGGLFGFIGWFWNRELGNFRAYVTHRKRTVVLKFENRTLVVSPGDPARFVEAVRTARPVPA